MDSPAEATRLAKLGEGSVARARGLADATFKELRHALFADVSASRGFDASALARRVDAFVTLAGKEASAKRLRARLVFGELIRLFRAASRIAGGLDTIHADPHDETAAHALADRIELESLLALAERCMEAEYQIRRNVYMPLVLEALTCDLARRINPRNR